MKETAQFPQEAASVPEKEPMTLIPEAYLDDLSGRKIVARVKNTDEYVLLVPSEQGFSISERGDWLKAASLTKYGFSSFETPQPEMTDLESFDPSEPDRKDD